MYAGFGDARDIRIQKLRDIPSFRRTVEQEAELAELVYAKAYEAKAGRAAELAAMTPAQKKARRLAFLESTGQGGSAEANKIRQELGQAAAQGDPSAKDAVEDIQKSQATGQPLVDLILKREKKLPMPLIIGGIAVAGIVLFLATRKKG